MATDTYSGSLGHERIAGAASGVSLSTTAAFVGLVKGTKLTTLITRNFSTAVVMRYAACPYLVVLKADSSNDLATVPTNYTEVAQDGSTSTDVTLSGLAAGRYLYVGSAVPFRGVNIDVDSTNSTGSTALTVRYWSGLWTDLSDSDGTASSVSLDQDGSVTWTVPSALPWRAASLARISVELGNGIADKFAWRDETMYWTRWEWSHAMDASVTLNAMLAINESTAYAEIPTGITRQARVHMGFGQDGIAGYEMLTNAGTANCLVNCASLDGYFSEGKVK